MADATTSTGFVFAWLGEPWQVAALVALAATAAWWGWSAYGPRAPGAAGVIARLARALALALLVLLAAGPSRAITTTTTVPGRVVVAVDRSASMARSDGPGGAARLAAAADLARALEGRAPRSAAVEWRDLADGSLIAAPVALTAADATGASSRLGEDLDRLVAQRRPEVLVVVSDGRTTGGRDPAEAAAGWAGRDLRAFALAVGGDRIEPELSIESVELNREVALDEQEPIAVRLGVRAPAGPVRVRVLVGGNEAGVAEAELGGEAGDPAALRPASARLNPAFKNEGPATVTIEATCGGLTRSRTMTVQVRERRLSVLLLEHAPRYETRYLREAFKRDRSLTLHAYLLEGRPKRWGAEGPTVWPLGKAELAAYDVVILGDIGPGTLGEGATRTLQALVDHVRTGGAGVVLIPGESGAIAGFAHDASAPLLPVELPSAEQITRGYLNARPQRLERTAVAEALGLLDAGTTPWSALPTLLGACPITEVRPGGDVLARDAQGAPLVVTRPLGRGRTVLVAVDDTWRWRRQVGDRFLHRFHSQLLRHAAAGRRAGAAAYRVVVSPVRATVGESVSFAVAPAGPAEGDQPAQVALRLTAGAVERVVRLERSGPGWQARLPAPPAGTWTIAAVDALPGGCEPGELSVATPADEGRDPRADRPALERFTAALGGSTHDDAAKLVAALPPDLGRPESTVATTGWWDTLWALLAALTLLGLDWGIRRWNRLP